MKGQVLFKGASKEGKKALQKTTKPKKKKKKTKKNTEGEDSGGLQQKNQFDDLPAYSFHQNGGEKNK